MRLSRSSLMEKERSMSRYRSIGKLLAGCTAKGNVTGSPAWVWREGGTVLTGGVQDNAG